MAASTLCPTLAQESVRVLRRRGVETVILAGADTHGIMRGKRVPIAELDRAAERGIALCDVIWALPVDEVEPVEPPRGTTAGSRATAIRTCSRCPTSRRPAWSRGTTARRCCCATSSIATAAPSRCRRARSCAPWSIAPGPWASSRSARDRARVLRAARDAAVGADEAPVAAARRCEERPSVYGVVAASRHEDFAGAVRATLQEYGLAVEACAPEAGPGQFEINVRAAPALRAADEAFLLKSAVKEIAARHGLLATFMAKPRSDWPGSSCHLHLSLRDGAPAAMRHFIGGLLEGMAELTAIFAPTPNSYRRLTPYSWAATTATWSVDNRSAGVRAIGDGDAIARVEHRQAGADANPYLAAAAALAAGLDGVRRACEPPPPVDGDVYALADGAVPALPRRWARPPTCSSAARWRATGWATTSSTTAWRCGRRSSRRSPLR